MFATRAEALATLVRVRLWAGRFSLDAFSWLVLEVRTIAAVAHAILPRVAVMARAIVAALAVSGQLLIG
jgi:hypothetical protein